MSVEAEFAGGPGHTPATELVDGERLRNYLDDSIREWRHRRDAVAATNLHGEHTMAKQAEHARAKHHVDAFQAIRASVFGEALRQ